VPADSETYPHGSFTRGRERGAGVSPGGPVRAGSGFPLIGGSDVPVPIVQTPSGQLELYRAACGSARTGGFPASQLLRRRPRRSPSGWTEWPRLTGRAAGVTVSDLRRRGHDQGREAGHGLSCSAVRTSAGRTRPSSAAEVQTRYGIDVDSTGADERSVYEALARAQQTRTEPESERTKARAARTDDVLAAAVVAGANRQDAVVQRAQAEPAFDSAERRQQLAESLGGKGDREAVNSRLLADKHQSAPATAAVTQEPSLARTSKVAKQGSKGKTLERGGWNARWTEGVACMEQHPEERERRPDLELASDEAVPRGPANPPRTR
jgi:hypothetical protein